MLQWNIDGKFILLNLLFSKSKRNVEPQLRYQCSYENSIYFWDIMRGSDASGCRQETDSLNLKVGAIHNLDTNTYAIINVLVSKRWI